MEKGLPRIRGDRPLVILGILSPRQATPHTRGSTCWWVKKISGGCRRARSTTVVVLEPEQFGYRIGIDLVALMVLYSRSGYPACGDRPLPQVQIMSHLGYPAYAGIDPRSFFA